jgi:hypothetical protein
MKGDINRMYVLIKRAIAANLPGAAVRRALESRRFSGRISALAIGKRRGSPGSGQKYRLRLSSAALECLARETPKQLDNVETVIGGGGGSVPIILVTGSRIVLI